MASSHSSTRRTFRPSKSYRNWAVILLLMYLGVAVAPVLSSDFDANVKQEPDLLWALFWFAISIQPGWMLLVYFRSILICTNRGKVFQQGVVKRTTLFLKDVEGLEWSAVNQSISLRTTSDIVKCYLPAFDPHEQLWLIRYFHNRLPQTIQCGWEKYCHEIALPLHDAYERQPVGPSVVSITRRHLEYYVVPFVVLALILGSIAWWRTGSPKILCFVASPFLLLWLLLRVSTPKQGLVTKQLNTKRVLIVVFASTWILFGYIVMAVVHPMRPSWIVTVGLLVIFLALSLVLLNWKVRPSLQIVKQSEHEAAKLSVERWKTIEGTDEARA